MSPIFLNGLLKVDFRHWGAVQYEQYHSLLGHVKYVGVEWECNFEAPKKELLPKEMKFSWVGGNRECLTRLKQSFEVQRLYNVENPNFIKELYSDIKWLQSLGPTVGSMHININHQEWLYCSPYASKDSNIEQGTGPLRFECKLFSQSFVKKDYIVQFLMAVQAVHVKKANNFRQNISRYREIVNKYYSEGEQLFSVIPAVCARFEY